ncbi:MAG: hypothetical protein QNJ30_14050 [Kiloniellales bacterium]|nr:hypothetical protein [Kiloniellales bacterium]
MKILPVLALLLAMPLLSGCAIFGVAAVGTAVAEGATADDDPDASNGIVARQWQAACAAVDGTVDPKSGDCNGDLFAYFFGGEKPEPAEPQPEPAQYQPQPPQAQPQPVEAQPVQ